MPRTPDSHAGRRRRKLRHRQAADLAFLKTAPPWCAWCGKATGKLLLARIGLPDGGEIPFRCHQRCFDELPAVVLRDGWDAMRARVRAGLEPRELREAVRHQ
jgi:hypothetical protein